MRFLRDAVITILALVVVVSIVAYSRIRAGGLSADAEPGALERAVATRLLRLSIPPDAQGQQNPFSAAPNTWRAAVDHFQDHCAICHGRDGRGRTEMGQNMYPKVPDLADQNIQRLSDGALFSIIQNGVRWTGMPAWKHEHTPEDTWKLVSFIRKTPTLSSKEIEGFAKESHEESHGADHHEHKHPEPRRPPG
jgi:mono/diheme cytochrome c family protein